MKLEYELKKYQNQTFDDFDDINFETIYECVCCDSKDLQTLAILKDSIETSQCNECGHIFHSKTLTGSFLDNWYKNNFAVTKSINNNKVLSNKGLNWKGIFFQKFLFGSPAILYDQIGFLVSKLINKKSNILDVGTGYGKRLLQFKKFGANTFGIEPSIERSSFAKKLGLNVKNIKISDLSYDTFKLKFDLVFSHHVLEHISHPNIFFQKIKKIIKPNGFLCIAVPDVETEFMLHNFFFVPHCNFFSTFSLSNLAKKYDFKLIKIIKEHQIILLFQHIDKLENQYYSESLISSSKNEKFNFNKVFFSIFNEKFNKKKIKKDIFWKSSDKKLYGNFDISYESLSDSNLNHINITTLDNDRNLPLTFIEKSKNFSSFWIK